LPGVGRQRIPRLRQTASQHGIAQRQQVVRIERIDGIARQRQHAVRSRFGQRIGSQSPAHRFRARIAGDGGGARRSQSRVVAQHATPLEILVHALRLAGEKRVQIGRFATERQYRAFPALGQRAQALRVPVQKRLNRRAEFIRLRQGHALLAAGVEGPACTGDNVGDKLRHFRIAGRFRHNDAVAIERFAVEIGHAIANALERQGGRRRRIRLRAVAHHVFGGPDQGLRLRLAVGQCAQRQFRERLEQTAPVGQPLQQPADRRAYLVAGDAAAAVAVEQIEETALAAERADRRARGGPQRVVQRQRRHQVVRRLDSQLVRAAVL